MKQNKVLIGSSFGSSFVNYKYSLTKFFELGILKNGLEKDHHYSVNTVYQCKKYLDQYFNKIFGAVCSDKKRSSAGNGTHHPKYLECIQNIEARMLTGYDHGYISGKYQYSELYQGMISLNNHFKSIIVAYFFVINVCA